MSWGIVAGAGASIVGGLLASDAAGDAAATQAAGQAAATAEQRRQFDLTRELQMPAISAGNAARNRLLSLLGIDPGPGATQSNGTPWATYDSLRSELLPQYTTRIQTGGERQQVGNGDNSDWVTNPLGTTEVIDENALRAAIQQRRAQQTAQQSAQSASMRADPSFGSAAQPFTFDPASVFSDPSYQFRLSEGQKAVERSAAARGGTNSGAALKALTRYGQDFASTEYGRIYDRDRSTFQMNRDNLLNPLQSLLGQGMSSANGLAAAGQANANALSGLYTSGANAQAASQIAQGNILGNSLSGAYGSYQTNQLLNGLNRPAWNTAGAYDPLNMYGRTGGIGD